MPNMNWIKTPEKQTNFFHILMIKPRLILRKSMIIIFFKDKENLFRVQGKNSWIEAEKIIQKYNKLA